jgi:hypothetical protein
MGYEGLAVEQSVRGAKQEDAAANQQENGGSESRPGNTSQRKAHVRLLGCFSVDFL